MGGRGGTAAAVPPERRRPKRAKPRREAKPPGGRPGPGSANEETTPPAWDPTALFADTRPAAPQISSERARPKVSVPREAGGRRAGAGMGKREGRRAECRPAAGPPLGTEPGPRGALSRRRPFFPQKTQGPGTKPLATAAPGETRRLQHRPRRGTRRAEPAPQHARLPTEPCLGPAGAFLRALPGVLQLCSRLSGTLPRSPDLGPTLTPSSPARSGERQPNNLEGSWGRLAKTEAMKESKIISSPWKTRLDSEFFGAVASPPRPRSQPSLAPAQ